MKGEGFLIEVVRNTSEYQYEGSSEGPNRWNVYAYIYPSHPHFNAFSGESLFQDAAMKLEFHCGPSYVRPYSEQGKPIHCWQVGSDYNHLHDDRFTHMSTKEEATEVFYDAESLFEQLTNMIAKDEARP